MAVQPISVFNRSAFVSVADLAAITAAINNVSMPAFAKAWSGLQAALTLGEPATAWALWLLDGDAPAGDLAFHAAQNGVPVMEIFPKTILACGASICQAIDHEVKEALADPAASKTVSLGGRTIVYENCDPVSEDTIDLGGGLLGANFVHPSWFVDGSSGPWDERGLCTKAGEIRPGGYVEAEVNGQWQITALRKDDGLLSWRLGHHGRLAYRARNR